MVRNNQREQDSPLTRINGVLENTVGDGGGGSKGKWQDLKHRLFQECPSEPSSQSEAVPQ